MLKPNIFINNINLEYVSNIIIMSLWFIYMYNLGYYNDGECFELPAAKLYQLSAIHIVRPQGVLATALEGFK